MRILKDFLAWSISVFVLLVIIVALITLLFFIFFQVNIFTELKVDYIPAIKMMAIISIFYGFLTSLFD